MSARVLSVRRGGERTVGNDERICGRSKILHGTRPHPRHHGRADSTRIAALHTSDGSVQHIGLLQRLKTSVIEVARQALAAMAGGIDDAPAEVPKRQRTVAPRQCPASSRPAVLHSSRARQKHRAECLDACDLV